VTSGKSEVNQEKAGENKKKVRKHLFFHEKVLSLHSKHKNGK